jgi:hypothetical protein
MPEKTSSGASFGKRNIPTRLSSREKRLCSSSEALASLFARLGGEEISKLASLWKNWTTVMGHDLASLGRPLGHKDRTLQIGADDSMALQDLALQVPDILERVNAFMGGEYFADVKVLLMQGGRDLETPLPARPEPAAAPEPPPPPLGRLMGTLDPDSPITRCYEIFVALSRRENSPK